MHLENGAMQEHCTLRLLALTVETTKLIVVQEPHIVHTRKLLCRSSELLIRNNRPEVRGLEGSRSVHLLHGVISNRLTVELALDDQSLTVCPPSNDICALIPSGRRETSDPTASLKLQSAVLFVVGRIHSRVEYLWVANEFCSLWCQN
jgi:hypothetical protein